MPVLVPNLASCPVLGLPPSGGDKTRANGRAACVEVGVSCWRAWRNRGGPWSHGPRALSTRAVGAIPSDCVSQTRHRSSQQSVAANETIPALRGRVMSELVPSLQRLHKNINKGQMAPSLFPRYLRTSSGSNFVVGCVWRQLFESWPWAECCRRPTAAVAKKTRRAPPTQRRQVG